MKAAKSKSLDFAAFVIQHIMRLSLYYSLLLLSAKTEKRKNPLPEAL